MSPTLFPFGVAPPSDDDAAETSRDDARGTDTVNRILLHGARHHDRDAVFLRWGQGRKGWGWRPTPDWRADRAAIRIALVLRRRLEVAEGERVAVWLRLGPEWAEIERGIWSIGAVSVAVDPAWPLARVAAVLGDAAPEVLFAPSLDRVRELEAVGGRPPDLRAVVPREAPEEQGEDWLSLAKFLEYGGVQDTPERASMWRTFARSVGPDALASLEYAGAAGAPGETSPGPPLRVTQGELREWAARLTRRFTPRKGGTRLVASDRPTLAGRVVLVAGWADGLTRTAFAASRIARERASELAPELVAGAGPEAAEILGRLKAGPEGSGAGSGATEGDGGPLGRLTRWILRAAPPPAGPEEARPLHFVSTEGPPTGGGGKAAIAGVEVVDARELIAVGDRSGGDGGSRGDRSGPGRNGGPGPEDLEKRAGNV